MLWRAIFASASEASAGDLFANADIARNEIRLFERDVEFSFIRKFERENFLLDTARRRHTVMSWRRTPDAVFEVNDKIAFIELAEVDLGAVAAELFRALLRRRP